MDEGGLAEEIEVLEAIYIEELDVQRNDKNEVNTITLQLHPATGEDKDQRFVCMTLILELSPQYPDVPPEITIKNPRGIAEEELLSLREDMHKLCEDRKGGPVLFELIELAKDSLTAGNIPHCPCMICLEHFHEGEKFTKTECYHYFHEGCLSRYVTHVLTQTPEIVPAHSEPCPAANKLLCPVCREEIHYKFDDFQTSPEVDDFVFSPTDEMRELQARMSAMLEQQRANGGVIDVEAERNKYLVKNDDIVLLKLPKAENKHKSDRPKSAQSRNEKESQENNKGNELRETDRDGERQGNRRNDNNRYVKGKGRGYGFNESNSPRDNEKSWRERRDRRKREDGFGGGSRSKTENGSYSSKGDNRIRNERNKSDDGNRDNRNRNRRNFQFKDKRPDEVKEELKREKDGELDCSEKIDISSEETTKEKKLGFGRPPEKETSVACNDSLYKEDSDGILDKQKGNRTGKDQKGFGRPNRTGENKNYSEKVEAACDYHADNTENENQIQYLESRTALQENGLHDDDLENVHSKVSYEQRSSDRKSKGNRGGFGSPPYKRDGKEKPDKDDRKSTQSNQTQRKGGFGRPNRESNRDENYTEERPGRSIESKTALQENGLHDDDLEKIHGKVSFEQRSSDRKSKGNRGRISSPPDKRDGIEEKSNKDDRKSTQSSQTHRKGGFGRPDREYNRDENYTEDRSGQNRGGSGKPHRGGFGKPGRQSKESSEEMSRPGSHETASHQDRKNSKTKCSPRNIEDQSKDDGRPWNSSRDRHYKDDRHSGNWRDHGRNNKYRSDDHLKYSNHEQSYKYPNSRNNQGHERPRYDNGHQRSFHKDREDKKDYRLRDRTQNDIARSGSRNTNISPRNLEQVDKDLGSVNSKFDNMIVSDKSRQAKNAEGDDDLRKVTYSKDCDKNESRNEVTRPLSSDSDRLKSDSKGDKKNAPPGFQVSPPPGFARTEGDGMSIIKPPPGFKS